MKITPLNGLHKSLGARMVDFAGWEMPVYYDQRQRRIEGVAPPASPVEGATRAPITNEHMAVRETCGLFDVSHMGEIEISGPKALETVQRLTCNDASKLIPGRSQYSAFLTEQGTFVDDIIVNRLAEDRFLICVNASNAEKDLAWVKKYAGDAAVMDRSHDYFLIALQGPRSADVFVRAFGPLALPDRPFQFVETKIAGVAAIVSRTGYTGEDGFEIYGPWGDAEKIWKPLQDAGAVPCGLGARDTLRLEAALPLYGHEIDDQTTPYEAGLGWIVKMTKGDFVGRDALEKSELKKKLVGIEMREPGIARQGNAIYHGENRVGVIASGTKAPFVDRAIATGFVPPEFASLGTKLRIDIHNKTRHAEVVPLPFFHRKQIRK